MSENEEKGFFGWIFANREKIVVEIMKYTYALALTLFYFATLITVGDYGLKWLLEYSPQFSLAWKGILFAASATLFAAATVILVWFLMIAYYLKAFNWFKKRFEFIDTTKEMDK